MTYLGMIGPWQLIIIIFGVLLPIVALIDILRSEFKGNDKIIWILLVLFLSLIGPIMYFINGTKQKIKR